MVRTFTGEEETPEFQRGVVDGYHACGVDLALGFSPESDEQLEVTVDLASLANPDTPEDYYSGWLGGYQVRRDLHG